VTPTDLPLRPAATVMLGRDAEAGGIEVLMVRRSVAAAFAGGMYVFPGGRVDAADGEAEVAEFVDSRWVAPAASLTAADRGELMLMPPTPSPTCASSPAATGSPPRWHGPTTPDRRRASSRASAAAPMAG
jgi:recombination protein RecT